MKTEARSGFSLRRLMVLAIICLVSTTVLGNAVTLEGPKSCARCSMDRTTFAYSRMVVTYTDGTSVGTCSIHCAVEDLKKNISRQVASLQVADYNSKDLIDAKSATWVVGGKQKGVMTSPAKWAFPRDSEARKFVEKSGGSITPFDQVMQAVREEVDQMDQTDELE